MRTATALLGVLALAAVGAAQAVYYTPAEEQAAFNQQRLMEAQQQPPQAAFPFTPPPIPGMAAQAAPPAPAGQAARFAEARRATDDDSGDDDDDDDAAEQRAPVRLPETPPRFAEVGRAMRRHSEGHQTLPSVEAVMKEAMVETGTETEEPATRTRPLNARAARRAARFRARRSEGDDEAGDDGSADEGDDGPPENEDRLDMPPADATTADDDAKGKTAEPRFAKAKAKAGAKAKAKAGGSATPIVASTEESGQSAARTEAMDSSDTEARKCTSRNSKGECVIRWSKGEMKWGVKTVPTGSLRSEADSKQAGTTKVEDGSAGSAEESSEESSDGANFVLSKHPEIAAKQKEYRKLHAELAEEHKWVVKVRGVIRSYQNKVFNVQSHITAGKSRLGKMRDEINGMIRKAKHDRLQYELKCAVEALQKLQGHSQALDTRIRDISQSKSSLRDTIGRIKLALGRASNEDFTTQERFQELVLNKPPSSHEVKDAMRFADASDDVKGAMSSLLEVLDKVQHPSQHLSADDEHERAAVRSLPALSLVEAGAESEAPAPAAHPQHRHYAVPNLPPPDTDIVGRDVDPSIAKEMLDEKFRAVMQDTRDNSFLD